MNPNTNLPANNLASQSSEAQGLFDEGYNLLRQPETIQQGIEKLELAAQQGELRANFILGEIHYFGIPGLPVNKQKAFAYFQLAEKQSTNPRVLYFLGLMLFYGDGIEQQEELGLEKIIAAANENDQDAQFNLAMLIETGHRLLLQDREQSRRYLTELAAKGHVPAKIELAKICLESDGNENLDNSAEAVLTSASDQGNLKAKYYLATILKNRNQADQERAVRLLEEVVDANYPLLEAYYLLGILYRDGIGVAQDHQYAYQLIWLSANEGNQAAMIALIEMLTHGIGVAKNVEASIPYYEKVIAQGHNAYRLTLGLMYLKGEEIPKDNEKGLKLLQEYAEQGGQDAFYELGVLFNDNQLVPRDEELAESYLEEARKMGHPSAPYELGFLRLHQAERAFIECNDIEAKYQLACMHLNIYISSQDALNSLIQYANLGHSGAQFKLWWDNLLSADEALHFLHEAGKNNFEPALMELARIYDEGLGVEQDYERADEYHAKAAQERSKVNQVQIEPPKAGNVTAQLQLGMRRLFQAERAFEGTYGTFYPHAQYEIACLRLDQYKNMNECKKSRDACREILINCADLGLAEAQYKLWEMALINKEDALDYLHRAAEQGYGPALFELAWLYDSGDGVEKDFKRALDYYEKAVEKNVKNAQCRLADIYLYGWGVPRDLQKARELYALAVAQGDEQAKFELVLLDIKPESARSPKEPRSTERLFNEWLKPLNYLCEHLNARDTQDYEEIQVAVNQLYSLLKSSGKKYFAHMPINEKTIGQFIMHCSELISQNQPIFETHRGWHTAHWLLKWCVGFLACLTVLPAAYIQFKIEGGIKQTFFSSQLPQTATAIAIGKMTQNLVELQHSLYNERDKPASNGDALLPILEHDGEQRSEVSLM